MANSIISSGKKKTGLLSAIDIMKGYTSMANNHELWTHQPLQSIPLEMKTKEWVMWNADWHENQALKHLPAKAERLQKLYNLAVGVINKSDYIYNPVGNDLSKHLGIIGVDENEQNLLEQFFPIVPNIIWVFMGEKIKRDNSVIVTTDDPECLTEQLQYKEDLVREILTQKAMQDKQMTLMKAGIIPNDDPNSQLSQQFQQEMEATQQLVEAEMKFKKYRTIAERWANAFIQKFGTRTNFDEIDLWAFADSLIADEAIIALNMREEDFAVEQLRPIATYVDIPFNKRYYSEGASSITNIEFMTLPDVTNTFRNDLSAEQIESLEQRYYQNISGNRIMFDFERGDSTATYDTSKSYDWNAQWSSRMKEEMSAENLQNFIKDVTRNRASGYTKAFNNEKLIRVTRVWWASQRKVGLLTKMEEGSSTPIIETVDENFLVTVKPVYDNSLLKEKSAKTLILGEHVDWKYVVQWRYVVKIGQNIPHYYKLSSNERDLDNIYLYGDPIRFQFKGDRNLYDAKPPIEGCRFSNLNTMSVSLVERLRPDQIIYNVLKNKVVKLLPRDIGKVLVLPDSMIKKNGLLEEDGLDPLFEAIDSARETGMLPTDDSRETASQSNGRFTQPMMVDMSTIEQVAMYLQVAENIKNSAYGIVGVSPQRMSDVGKSESATGVQAAVEGSVNQTEMYFELYHTHFIPRVWQMILHAGQYYSSFSESFNDSYINNKEERVFFGVAKIEDLLKDMFIKPTSKADVKQLMKELKQLTIQDNTMGATFLDKVKTLFSKSPNEIIEKLEIASDKLQQEKEREFKHQQEMQQKAQEAQAAIEKEIQAREDARLDAKLDNEYAIAQLQVNSQAPPPDNSVKEGLEYRKLDLASQNQEATNQQNERKQLLAEQQNKDNTTLAKEKLQVEREKIAAQQNIAVQNKNASDVKFMQMQKNKPAKK